MFRQISDVNAFENKLYELGERNYLLDGSNVGHGVSSFAQIDDNDMAEPMSPAETDDEMIQMWAVQHYFKFNMATINCKVVGDRVH